MQHYFIDKPHNASDYFMFSEKFLDREYTFKSVDSVFSKNKIDEGTKVLLATVIANVNLTGDVLDFGCGIGPIGIILKTLFPNINVDMIDVNNTAVELSKENCKTNKTDTNNVFYSNLYGNIDKKYDYIVTNPPIKVGKEILFNVISKGYDHLKQNGEIILVIRKDHGQESMKKHMLSLFGNCEILKRDKGYYIMRSKKEV